MNRPWPKEFEGLVVKPIDPRRAKLLRLVCTHYELHTVCPLRPCMRANACATRNVVCYQALQDDLQPIVRSLLAHAWLRRRSLGVDLDVAPARVADMMRLLAWEEAEEKLARGEPAETAETGPDFGYDPDRPADSGPTRPSKTRAPSTT